MPHIVHISASPKQLSKLRNGHKVRIKPAMSGEGFNLIVSPEKYNIVSRSFARGKGTEIQLTPEEIMSNKQITPEQHQEMGGKGIFGKTFDKGLKAVLGKKGVKTLYKAASVLRDPLKQAVDAAASYAPEIGATELSGLAAATLQPELIPLAAAAGHKLGSMVGNKGAKLIKQHIDKPSNVGGPRNLLAQSTLANTVKQSDILNEINKQLDTNYGYLSRANLGTALANRDNALLNDRVFGNGLYAGSTVGRGHYKIEKSSVGRGGGMLGGNLHPALLSQPFAVNFQFQHTMPPQFQKYSKGSGLYA